MKPTLERLIAERDGPGKWLPIPVTSFLFTCAQKRLLKQGKTIVCDGCTLRRIDHLERKKAFDAEQEAERARLESEEPT